MTITVELFDGSRIEFPDDTSKDVIDRVARQKTREIQGIKPESGGVAALKSGIQGLIGAGAALAGRAGLMDVDAAQREYEARKQRAEEIFQPNPEGWGAPINKILELAGSSAPYMALPVAAGAATLALPATAAAAPVLGGLTTLGTAAGLGAAGLTSAAQFTGSNLVRQMETGKGLRETELGSAIAAAIPQALLDTVAMRMIPGVGRLFSEAGVKVTKANAEAIAKQALSTTLKDYAVSTGRAMTTEGITEAAQQSLERLQAGLSISDPAARDEYLESFIGGAVLGGVLSPAGRYVERGGEQREARGILKAEADRVAKEQRDAEEARKQTPEYLLELETRFNEAKAKKAELDAAAAKPAKGATPEEKEAYVEAKKARDAFAKTEFAPIFREYQSRKAEIDTLAEQRNQAIELAAAQTIPQEAQTQPFYQPPADEEGRRQATLPGMEAVEQPAAPAVEEAPRSREELTFERDRLQRLADERQGMAADASARADVESAQRAIQELRQIQALQAETEAQLKALPKAAPTMQALQDKLRKLGESKEMFDPDKAATLLDQIAALKQQGEVAVQQPELPGMETDYFAEAAVKERIARAENDAQRRKELRDYQERVGALFKTQEQQRQQTADMYSDVVRAAQRRAEEQAKVQQEEQAEAQRKQREEELTTKLSETLITQPPPRTPIASIEPATTESSADTYDNITELRARLSFAQATRNKGLETQTRRQLEAANAPAEEVKGSALDLGATAQAAGVEGKLGAEAMEQNRISRLAQRQLMAYDELVNHVDTAREVEQKQVPPKEQAQLKYRAEQLKQVVLGFAVEEIQSRRRQYGLPELEHKEVMRAVYGLAKPLNELITRGAQIFEEPVVQRAQQRGTETVVGAQEVRPPAGQRTFNQRSFDAATGTLLEQFRDLVEKISGVPETAAPRAPVEKKVTRIPAEKREGAAPVSTAPAATPTAAPAEAAAPVERPRTAQEIVRYFKDEYDPAIKPQIDNQLKGIASLEASVDKLETQLAAAQGEQKTKLAQRLNNAQTALVKATDTLYNLYASAPRKKVVVTPVAATEAETKEAKARSAEETKAALESKAERERQFAALEEKIFGLGNKAAQIESRLSRAKKPDVRDRLGAELKKLRDEATIAEAQYETLAKPLTTSERKRLYKQRASRFKGKGGLSEKSLLATIAQKIEDKKQLSPYEKAVWERRNQLTPAKLKELQAEEAPIEGVDTLEAADEQLFTDLSKADLTPAQRKLFDNAKRLFTTMSEAQRKQVRTQANALIGGRKDEANIDKVDKAVKAAEKQQAIEPDETRYARGVETATPDLNEAQIAAIEANDVRKALTLLSKDSAASDAHRKIAARLADLLDATRIEIVDGLKDSDGKPVLGAASTDGKLIQLDRKTGLSHEALLHEAVHAAAERVLNTPDAQLTKEQVAAKRELRALFEAIKRDARITSATAKASINEFVAEVMSNKNLQQQLSKRPWRLADALRAFKSAILRMLGVKETETMLGAATKAIDAIFLPTSVQLETSKRGGKRKYSQKDIAALHAGSNSMRQFADNFGQFIKQKDRTVEDVERISTEYLNDMYKNPEDYVSKAEPDRLDYKSATIMSDGKPFDPENALHLVEATPDVFANLMAQKDAKLRQREAEQITKDRLSAFNNVLEILTTNPNYTLAENALVAKAASKFGVISTPQGRLKLVNIDATNRHPIAIVDENAANAVIEELRAGKSLKDAFLDGLQKNADNSVERNRNKNGWQKFDQANKANLEEAAIALNSGAAGTSWCTGASVNHARYQIEGGDFYIYYENGKPEVAVRMTGKDRINEIRGNTPNQALNPKQQEIADKFLRGKNFQGSQKFFNETKRRAALIRLFKDEANIDDGMYFSDKLSDVKKLFDFNILDGHTRLRPPPSKAVIEFTKNKTEALVKKGLDAGYVPFEISFKDASAPGKYTAFGEDRTIDAKDLVMAEKITIDSAYNNVNQLEELPKLEKVRTLFMLGHNLRLPALQKAKTITIFDGSFLSQPKKEKVLELGKNAVVQELDAYGNVKASIIGGKHVTFEGVRDRGVFTEIKIDAPYVSQKDASEKTLLGKVADAYAYKFRSMLDSALAKRGKTSLYFLISDRDKVDTDQDAWFNSYKTVEKEARAFAKMLEPALAKYGKEDVRIAGLKDGTSDGYVALKDFIEAWLEVGKIHAGKKLDYYEWRDNFNEVFDPLLEDRNTLLEVGNKINSSLDKYEPRVLTELPVVTTPNKIADNPPIEQAGAEEEPTMRYARAGKPKYAAGLEDASKAASKLFAPQKTFREKLAAALFGFRAQFIDAYDSTEETFRRAGTDPLKATQAMYLLRMYNQRTHFTSQAVFNGAPELRKLVRKDGKEERLIQAKPGANVAKVVEILKRKDVVQAAGSADAADQMYSLYRIAKRAENVGYDKLNFKDPVAVRESVRAAMAQIEANPTLSKAFKEADAIYNQYNRDLLNFLVETGAINKELAERLVKNDDYVPYYRERDGVVNLMIGGETPIRIGNLKDSPHLQELVGGDEPVVSFLEGAVQNTSMLVDMAMHNIAIKNLMMELREAGLAKVYPVKKSNPPKGAVTFKIKGVEHYAIVDTASLGIDSELLVKGLEGIPTMFPAFVRIMGVPSRILRRLIVASPVYMARQLLRDSTTAALASGANIIPVVDALRQIGKENVLEARGITGGQTFTGMPEDITRILKDMQSGKLSLTAGLAWLETQSAKADALTRKAQYDSYIKQGMSEMEATMAALESMNFSRRGMSPTVHMLNTLIPFFNSQIQGLDVLYRAFTGKMPMNEKLEIRRKLIQRGLLLAGMSFAYALAMQDDEAYKNAKPEEKYGNWFVHVPGFDQPVRIPIPFELGYIFKALPEALVNILSKEEGGEEALKALGHIVQQTIPGMSSYFMPQGVKPAIETVLNTSFYTKRGIESGRELELEPGERYRDGTSALAKEVGSFVGFSPIKLEYLIRGYTGGMGMALVQALSLPFSREGAQPAEKRWSDLPVIGTAFQPTDASGIIDATYDAMKEVSQKQATYKRMLEEGRNEDAQAYLEKNLASIEQASLAGRFRQQMGAITAQENKVKRSPELTPAQKRQRLDELRQAKIELATAVRESGRTARQASLGG